MNNCLIYPGSFDPMHYGHVFAFKQAYDILCPCISYLVLQDNRFKDSHMFTTSSRYHILTEICKELKHSGYEVTLHFEDGIEFFIDIFRSLKHSISTNHKSIKYHVLIGDDVLDSIKNWHEFDILNNEVNFVIMERHYNSSEIISKCNELGVKTWSILQLKIVAASTLIRNEMTKKIIHDALQ